MGKRATFFDLPVIRVFNPRNWRSKQWLAFAGRSTVGASRQLSLLLALYLVAFKFGSIAAILVALALFIWAMKPVIRFNSHSHATGFILYILMFAAFVHLRTFADETGIGVHFSYPAHIDKMLFFGEVPTRWLQRQFHDSTDPSVLDTILTIVYFSYFIVPHVFSFYSLRSGLDVYPRLPMAIILTLYAGLVIYFAVPTAPPWLASQSGDIGGVTRIVRHVAEASQPGSYEAGSRAVGSNDVAAMPSLHMAITVVVALGLSRFGVRWGCLGIAYALAMGFALVYLGEHYVTDVVAGTVIAFAVWALTGLSQVVSPRALEVGVVGHGWWVPQGVRNRNLAYPDDASVPRSCRP